MSFLASLNQALGRSNPNAGQSQGPASGRSFSNNPSDSSESGSQGNGGTEIYGNNGAPISDTQQGAPNTPGNFNSAPSGGRTDPNSNQSSLSLEQLLFAEPPADQNNQQGEQQKPQNNQQNDYLSTEIAPGLTPQKLINNLNSVNFLQAVPSDVMEKALAGDAEAFRQTLSSVAQLSAMVAIQQSLTSSRGQIDQRFQDVDSRVESRIGEARYNDVLADPRFSDPFIKPLATDLVSRLRKQDPKITPEQIKEALPKLIDHAVKRMTSGQEPSNQLGTSNQNNQAGRQIQRPVTDVNYDNVF